MADSVELRMSVTSIKRVDPYVKDILANATHVALYIFNISTNAWEKTETEGALFIYSRNGEPFHSIMVMNRLNTDNLIEPIVKDFDYQMQVPFLLYRNSKSKIFGIWFFDKEECIRITCMIESLMEGLKDKNDEKSKKSDGGVDIFSMLTKAQETFNRTPIKQEGPPTFSSTPRVPDVTSQSVMDFFAKASTKSSQKPTVSGGNGENVLQRLMSNPAHTVEHIEKQQRSITPQEHLNVHQKAAANADRRSVPISFPGPSKSEIKSQPENGFSMIGHQQMQSTSPFAFLMQNQNQARPDKEDKTDLLGTSPFAQFLDTQKPHLMTPMMFTNSATKENSNDPTEEKLEQTDLLTEKQLAQALIYLLKNNSDFTKQIHEAYVKSIMERVNLNTPGETNIVRKEEEKHTKYRDRLFELRRLSSNHSVKMVVLIIGGSWRNDGHTALESEDYTYRCRDAAEILWAGAWGQGPTRIFAMKNLIKIDLENSFHWLSFFRR